MWLLLLVCIIVDIWVSFQRHPISHCLKLLIHLFKRWPLWTYINSFAFLLADCIVPGATLISFGLLRTALKCHHLLCVLLKGQLLLYYLMDISSLRILLINHLVSCCETSLLLWELQFGDSCVNIAIFSASNFKAHLLFIFQLVLS